MGDSKTLDIWHHLETFLVIRTWGGKAATDLSSRGQAGRQTPRCTGQPHSNSELAQNFSHAEVEASPMCVSYINSFKHLCIIQTPIRFVKFSNIAYVQTASCKLTIH